MTRKREARPRSRWAVKRPDGKVFHDFQSRQRARNWILMVVGPGRGWTPVRRSKKP
jgi:hypothetical protein